MTSLPLCAILDDYQNVALTSSDWSVLEGQVTLRRYDTHLGSEDAIVEALADCTIVIAMRERTSFPATLLRRLPNLRLLVTTGLRNRSIDLEAARACGITVCGTPAAGNPAAELAWAGMLAQMRNLPAEIENLRRGGPWQIGLGRSVKGKRLGLVGLGKLGSKVAQFGKAFDMEVFGWNRRNLQTRAETLGIAPLALPDLFSTCDVVMIQLVLSAETHGIVSRDLIERMKPDALLVNTSRGPLVDEEALVDALHAKRIGGAVLDVFDTEPLPVDHPFRQLPNVLATPHIGYVTEENYKAYFSGAIEAVSGWLDGAVVRELT